MTFFHYAFSRLTAIQLHQRRVVSGRHSAGNVDEFWSHESLHRQACGGV